MRIAFLEPIKKETKIEQTYKIKVTDSARCKTKSLSTLSNDLLHEYEQKDDKCRLENRKIKALQLSRL